MHSRISIKGLDRASVLIALYTHTLTFSSSHPLTKSAAQEALDRNSCWFNGPAQSIDYLNAIAIKVIFQGDYLFINEYDTYHGSGMAAKAVDKLRKGDLTPPLSASPTFLGVFERFHFDNKLCLKKKFSDSDFGKITIENSARDGFDCSQLKVGETLVAICTAWGQEPILYECSTSNQVKETRGFESIEWFIRKRNNPETILQNQQTNNLINDTIKEDNSSLKPSW